MTWRRIYENIVTRRADIDSLPARIEDIRQMLVNHATTARYTINATHPG
jgi:hypothetical protein